MLDSIAYVINAIWGVFTSIGLNDIVDIAILSFLIFHGIKLIRETRAQQLTKGILILIGCYLLAVFFNLQTIRFLLRICFQCSVLSSESLELKKLKPPRLVRPTFSRTRLSSG